MIAASVAAMVGRVQDYVPGYRLKQAVQFERFGSNRPIHIPGYGDFTGVKTSIYLEVEGAGDYLPLVRKNGRRSANLIFSVPGFALGYDVLVMSVCGMPA